jgi:hypothetical protein
MSLPLASVPARTRRVAARATSTRVFMAAAGRRMDAVTPAAHAYKARVTSGALSLSLSLVGRASNSAALIGQWGKD